MSEVPPIHKKIAWHIRDCFGGDMTVKNYYGDNDNITIDILRCEASPYEGVASFSTVGLSDMLGWESSDGTPFGIELVGAAHDAFDEFANLLASAARMVKRLEIHCKPHQILEGVVADYEVSSTMCHMICVDPFLWNPGPETLDLGETMTVWLQVLPISEREFQYSQSNGPEAMLDQLGSAGYDILDLNRPCSASTS